MKLFKKISLTLALVVVLYFAFWGVVIFRAIVERAMNP